MPPGTSWLGKYHAPRRAPLARVSLPSHVRSPRSIVLALSRRHIVDKKTAGAVGFLGRPKLAKAKLKRQALETASLAWVRVVWLALSGSRRKGFEGDGVLEVGCRREDGKLIHIRPRIVLFRRVWRWRGNGWMGIMAERPAFQGHWPNVPIATDSPTLHMSEASCCISDPDSLLNAKSYNYFQSRVTNYKTQKFVTLAQSGSSTHRTFFSIVVKVKSNVTSTKPAR